MKFIQILSVFLLFVFSCKSKGDQLIDVDNNTVFQHITKVEITETDDTILCKSGGKTIYFSKNDLPLQTAMAIPTSAIAYMSELDLTDKITGISQPDFIYNPKFQQRISEEKTIVIGTFDEIFIEKILINKPDVFFSTSSPTLAKFHEQLEKENIKVIYIDEYEELNPLARAEYIRLFGILFGKEKEASERFTEIEKNYNEITSLVQKNKSENPSVFANRIYGDVWYMPGGKSFQAGMIADAGGDYLWLSDESSGSLNLSFETVFEKANNADVWINAGDFPDKNSLLASYKNYEWFSAFKSGEVYNWNKRITEKGANDYFETGTARPDLVLKDLAAIFHPELFPDHELLFYKKLE